MGHRTDQHPQQPTPANLAPQPNQILAQPASVAACQTDYKQATDVRQTMAQQDARARR